MGLGLGVDSARIECLFGGHSQLIAGSAGYWLLIMWVCYGTGFHTNRHGTGLTNGGND